MAAISVQVPYPVFYDRDGNPLENGSIYIGTANLDPLTNPIQVYYDEALTIPASQPLKTSGGYVYRNGTPTQLYVNANDFSITVKDEHDLFVYNFPEATGVGVGAAAIGFTGFKGQVGNVEDLADNDGSDWIGFDPAGVGSVARSAQDKMADVVSVKDFGAVGDGVADDTAAIQAFFDACQNGRGYMPPGIYKITSTLNLLPEYSYNIEGSAYKNTADAGTVIHNAGTGTAILVNNEPYSPPNFDSQIRLANLTISGNASSEHGIFADHVMIYLENVWLTGHGQNGLFLRRAYASAFKQVTCANNYMYGALISTAGNLMHFDHCVFNGNSQLDGYAGMRMTAVPDPLGENFSVVFTSCDFTGNGQTVGVTTAFGAQVGEAYGASFIGCYWESNKSANLYADSTVKNLTVSGCFFQDADNDISNVDGLIYENNFHLSTGTSTVANIAGAMPSDRFPTRMFGNTYLGGASSNPQAGVSENIQLWFSAPPSGGTWKRGDIVWNSNFQSGGGVPGWTCITPGTPGTWLPMGQAPYVYTNWGDNSTTLTTGTSLPTNIWRSPLTANRTVTLSSTNAFSGAKFRINRTSGATGAFTLDVGGLKSLAAGEWCDVEWDGSAWVVTAAGSL